MRTVLSTIVTDTSKVCPALTVEGTDCETNTALSLSGRVSVAVPRLPAASVAEYVAR